MPNKGNIPWNKGLTKENDKRVKAYSDKLTTKIRSELVTKYHKNMTKIQREKRANNISIGRKGMKFSDKHCENMSLSGMGHTPWNKGTKGVMKVSSSSFKKGYKFSKNSILQRIIIRRVNGWFKDIEKTRKLKSRENHWNWKGGITPLHKKIRTFLEYSQWRNAVFNRDNYTCQDCGKHGGYLEVHHKNPFRYILKECKIKTWQDALNCRNMWDIDNGITYCLECHIKNDKMRVRHPHRKK